MESPKYSIGKLAFLLAFIVIASNMCMKSEARGPIMRIFCKTDEDCQLGCRGRTACGCAAKCINLICSCPPASANSFINPPPAN
ncbi:hypothetical protein CR513_39467, partial [Mucuna pruriens]